MDISMDGLQNIEVIGLGQACFDFLGQIPYFPNEDTKIEITDLHMQCGGPDSAGKVWYIIVVYRFNIR